MGRHSGHMIDHFGVPVRDIAVSATFYDTVLGVLGSQRLLDHDEAIGYGVDHPVFWIFGAGLEGDATVPELHIAFQAPDAAAVRAFHATALGAGAVSRHEPRLWPEYHPAYYGAFVTDPDGHNVEAVCHTGEA